MTHFLVTGATGFVGRALVPVLHQAGHGVRVAVRTAAAAEGLPPGVAPAVVGDIGADTDWTCAVRGVDVVIHLAAHVHVMGGAADPADYRRVNVAGTEVLARAARDAGARRLVFASSVKVHGETSGASPLTERDTPRPTDPYGVSKWDAEQALHALARPGAFDIVVVRPPLVYGPGVGANFLQLMRLVERGIPLPLGSVRNRRSLVYVGNLADALLACAMAPAAAGATFLVSDGEDVSTGELVRRLARAMDRPARCWPVPLGLLRMAAALLGRAEQVHRLTESLAVDSTAIRVTLPWRPPFTLDEGLSATVRYARGLAGASKPNGGAGL